MNEIPKSKILILDEDQGLTDLCVQALNGAGYYALGVNFPKEALALLKHQGIDVLMVGARLRGMDSLQLIDTVRQGRPNLAVVLMAGWGDIETALNSLINRVDGILVKQFTEDEVIDRVKQAIHNRRQKRVSLRFRSLEPLMETFKNIFSAQDLDTLAELTLEAARTFLDCGNVAVYFRSEEDPEQFEVVKKVGKDIPFLEIPRSYSSGIANLGDPSSTMERSVLEQFELGTLLWSPIQDAKSYLGLVIAGRDKNGMNFDSLDLAVVDLFNGYIGTTLRTLRKQIEIKTEKQSIEKTQTMLREMKESGSIGRLMTSVAHEINNPLQAVQVNLELLGRATRPEDQKRYLAIVRQELSRLQRVVKDMLNLYRPDQKAKDRFSINESLEHVLSLYVSTMAEQGIRVQVDLADDLPEVWGWSDRIQQVFTNLITNAIEAMPNGGELFASTELQKNKISIIIKDTGPGIPSEYGNRIFDPFFTTKEGSHGLGLAICDNIISAQHQGKIELETNSEVGACFIITIPIGG